MQKRSITSALIVLGAALIIGLSYVPGILLCAAVLLGTFSVYEVYCVSRITKSKRFLIVSILFSALLIVFPIPNLIFFLSFAFLLSLAWFGWLIYQYESGHPALSFNAVWIALLLVFLIKAIPTFRTVDNGLYYLTASVVICFIADSFAYLIGSKFGRHKLSPHVSPHKTVEGAAAGIVSATAILLLVGIALDHIGYIHVNLWLLGIYGISASLIGLFGDLALSVLKRISGMKDFGKVFPGHGGVLDRFDSHIFSLAYTLIFCAVTGGFII